MNGDGYVIQALDPNTGQWDDVDCGYTDVEEAREALASEALNDPDSDLRPVLPIASVEEEAE